MSKQFRRHEGHTLSRSQRVSQEEISQEGASPEEVSPKEVSPEIISPEEVSPEEFSQEEVSPEKFSQEEVSPEEVVVYVCWGTALKFVFRLRLQKISTPYAQHTIPKGRGHGFNDSIYL